MFSTFLIPELWHQRHLCLVCCIPRAFGWKIIHRDQDISWESCSAVVQGKHSQKLTCRMHYLMLLHCAAFHNTCHTCVCIVESPGIRGEGFSHVPQILGWVQQRSWLHGLLVQVTILPSTSFCFHLILDWCSICRLTIWCSLSFLLLHLFSFFWHQFFFSHSIWYWDCRLVCFLSLQCFFKYK